MSRVPSSTRRRVIRGLGAVAATAAAAPGLAAAETYGAAGPDRFRVSGTLSVELDVSPTEIVRRERRRSDDLLDRYGTDSLFDVRRIGRTSPLDDSLPRTATMTETRRWDTYYATPGEWAAFLTGDDAGDPASGEESHPFGVWEYERASGGYEVSAPVNLVSPATPAADVADLLEDAADWTTEVAEYDRWAWNSGANEFVRQDAAAATAPFGVFGRTHVRFWAFDGYASGSAHVDSDAPHHATSLEDAERRIESVFADADGWTADYDHYALHDGGELDSDGLATRLSRT